MIHIKRPAKPKSLQSKWVKKMKDSLQAFYAMPESDRAQKKPHFDTSKLSGLIKEDLQKTFLGKCVYCESRITSSPGATEHFRPKIGAVNLDGKKSEEHYWWLAYEWFNLYLACQSCNMMKASRFPVEGERAPINASEKELREEKYLLLDPCFDFPEDHLFFNEIGFVASETNRGKLTIDILNLNREVLVSERFRLIKQLKLLWETFLSIIKHDETSEKLSNLKEYIYSNEGDFLGMRRCLLQQWSLEAVEKNLVSEDKVKAYLSFRTVIKDQFFDPSPNAESDKPISSKTIKTEIGKKIKTFEKEQIAQDKYSLTDLSQTENYFRKARFIERVEIHNFKVIENLTLSFPFDTEGKGAWLLLLGENGMGKSSVLQAVALTLMGTKVRSLIGIKDASKFVTYGQSEGSVRVHLTGGIAPIELKFKSGSKKFITNTLEPKVLLLAYGATRLLPRKESSLFEGSEVSRPFNLFNPFIALKDSAAWLFEKYMQDDRKQFDEAAFIIKKLFMLNDDDKLVLAENEKTMEVEGPTFSGRVSLEDLSAGYQSVLAMATDIMSVLSSIWDSIQSAEGIVLIDEIDAHLHPRWKLQIVKRLRECFPQVQFLATSHDPLTLRGLSEKEIAVMGRGINGKIFAQTDDLPNPQALRVDQLLTSEFFGLNSTIDEALDDKFNEYYALLALKKPTREQKKKIAEYRAELENLNQMGSTPRERIMLEAADSYISQRKQKDKTLEIKDETRNEILDLWNKI